MPHIHPNQNNLIETESGIVLLSAVLVIVINAAMIYICWGSTEPHAVADFISYAAPIWAAMTGGVAIYSNNEGQKRKRLEIALYLITLLFLCTGFGAYFIVRPLKADTILGLAWFISLTSIGMTLVAAAAIVDYHRVFAKSEAKPMRAARIVLGIVFIIGLAWAAATGERYLLQQNAEKPNPPHENKSP
jgi:cytochrome c biogenesis factor